MPYQIHDHIHYRSLTLLITLLSLNPSIKAQPSPPPSDDNYGSPLSTSAIIIIVVVVVVGFSVCYIRHCVICIGSYIFGTTQDDATNGDGIRRRDIGQGLDPTILATFPTFSYSQVKLHLVTKTTPLECAICLNEFVDQDLLRLLPTCNHVFHPDCISPWFATHATCPVCRADLEIQVDNKNHAESLAHVLVHQTPLEESQPSDHDHDHDQITQPHDHDDVILRLEEDSPEIMIKSSPNVAHKSQTNGVGNFPRSHSTGHSLVDNCDRFTLRLPQEVRNKLVNVNNLNGFSASMVSPPIGYRASSVGSATTLSIKPDRWRFTMSPSFFIRFGSLDIAESSNSDNNSNNNNNNNTSTNNLLGIMRSPKSLLKSMKSPTKSPLNQPRCDDIGERSSDKLWPKHTSQELD